MTDKEKKQYIILGVLGLVVVGVLVYQFVFASTETPPPPPPAAQSGSAAPSTPAQPTASAASASSASHSASSSTALKRLDINIDDLLAKIKDIEFDYNKERMAANVRNPMTPRVGRIDVTDENGGAEQGPTTQVELKAEVTGIIYNDRDPVAVVNNEVVSPGYVFPKKNQFDPEIVVDSIEPDRVIFRVGKDLIPVKMKEL